MRRLSEEEFNSRAFKTSRALKELIQSYSGKGKPKITPAKFKEFLIDLVAIQIDVQNLELELVEYI